MLDLRGLADFTDLFVVCSADSEPQIKAIVGEIEDRLQKEHRLRPSAVDGFPTSQWVVIDYLQVLVHVFHADKRRFYGLEELWSDAPRLDWEEATPGPQAHGLRG